jgi:hypothetical protein
MPANTTAPPRAVRGWTGLAKEQPGQPGGDDRLAQEADRDDGGIQVP